MKALLTILMAIFFVACGSANPEGYQTAAEKAATEKAASSSSSSSSALSTSDYFMVEGYVSPISIAVDGKSYRDSEDFYTQELSRLQTLVKAQYPGYKLTFDAQVGLRNFKSGMYVFLVATEDVGVASESYVDTTGKFSFMLAGNVDRKAEYTLRATKRIGLKLSKKGEETVSWCYNMFAEKNVALNGQPNVLRNFATSVTEYQCSDQTDGITLPDVPTDPETEASIAKEAEARAVTAENEANTKTILEQEHKDTIAAIEGVEAAE